MMLERFCVAQSKQKVWKYTGILDLEFGVVCMVRALYCL